MGRGGGAGSAVAALRPRAPYQPMPPKLHRAALRTALAPLHASRPHAVYANPTLTLPLDARSKEPPAFGAVTPRDFHCWRAVASPPCGRIRPWTVFFYVISVLCVYACGFVKTQHEMCVPYKLE